MDAPMMLTFCEAPSGKYQEVVKIASKRLRMIPDCVLNNLAKDGLLDDSYDDFEPREDELYDLDKWALFELEHSNAFAEMYQFWCQKSA